MITQDVQERLEGWFAGRLPEAWQDRPAAITVDREEITVSLAIADVELGDDASDAARAEAREGRARKFREETREARIEIAQEAERRYEHAISWAVRIGDHAETWTSVATPVMTRLRQPQRLVLDTLVEAGVARSRSDALAWCVRLVGEHEGDWLTELRDAMASVADVRSRGPAA
jgi:post-segregation antitoxin (ccd killing protein)